MNLRHCRDELDAQTPVDLVRGRDRVTLDIIYLAGPRRIRQGFALVSARAILLGMLRSLLPTSDHIDWMKIRSIATVREPFSGGRSRCARYS